jgi:hypothetical protein
MPREIRISPDGDSVAIRTDEQDPESIKAWGVMRALKGGYWARTAQLDDWTVLQ